MSLHHVHYSRAKEGLMDLVLAKSVSVSNLGELCESVYVGSPGKCSIYFCCHLAVYTSI